MTDTLDSLILRTLSADDSGPNQRTLFGLPAYTVGRSVFACLYEGRIGMKLPPSEAEAVRGMAGLGDFTPYGKRMRQWVGVELEDFCDDHAPLLRQAAAYAKAREQEKP